MSRVVRLRSDVCELPTRAQLHRHRVAAHFAELASVRGYMTWVEEYVEIAQRQLIDAQAALIGVKCESNGYCSHFGIMVRRVFSD